MSFCDVTKRYPLQYEQQRSSVGGAGGGVLKSFTHIEHRAGAVGREGLGHLIPVLTPEYFTSVSVGSSPHSYSLG